MKFNLIILLFTCSILSMESVAYGDRGGGRGAGGPGGLGGPGGPGDRGGPGGAGRLRDAGGPGDAGPGRQIQNLPAQQRIEERPRAPEPSLRQQQSQMREARQQQQQVNFVPRSPSMSRSYTPPNIQPNQPKGRQEIVPKQQSPEAIRQQVHQFTQSRPAQQPSLSSQLGGKSSQERQSFFLNQKSANRNISQDVNSRMRMSHPNNQKLFSGNFFQDHSFQPSYWNNNVNWWRGARWGQIHDWLSWDDSVYPYYYDEYGYGYPMQTNVDLDSYLQPDLSQGAPPPPPESVEQGSNWLPLGVFVLGSDTTQAAYSNIFMQLALDRSGEISGTYYNSSSDNTYPMGGYVDPQTQQVYWKIAEENTDQIMTTGLYNLTQDVVNIQLIFPEGTVQNWVMVKISK